MPTTETVTEEDSNDEEDVVAEMDHGYGLQSHDHNLATTAKAMGL